MDINPLIESLRRDLVTAAEAGGTEVREAAERLAFALEPAVRLTLMDALTQAADVISTELSGTAVEVRLKGREPFFVVTGSSEAPAPEPVPGSADEQVDAEEEEGALVRITLRIPESLKTKAEELAARRGQSLNTWLVNAARVASIGIDVSGWGSASPPAVPSRRPGKRIQGWVR
jgi:hypothetical protein